MAAPERDMLQLIARLSHELVRLVDRGCVLTDPLLVQRSQNLDRLIVEWCRQHSSPI